MLAVEKFRRREPIVGTMIRLCNNPAIVSVAKDSGLDFIMYDLEHAFYSIDRLSDLFVASQSAGIASFVRVPELAKGYVSRILDAGATGIMVPMMESVEQAKEFVHWAKYTPVGNRGIATTGGHTGYKKAGSLKEFMEEQNTGTITIAQIETVKGLEAAADIAAVDGIDALLIGPFDFSVSLGVPGDITSDTVVNAMIRVLEAAESNGKTFGIHGNVPLMEKFIPMGMRLIMHSTDIDLLSSGMKNIVNTCNKIINQ